ncbi:hypothetical protein SAMN05421821_10294 [Mucilaginibacter lappiensis]|uniref:DUF4265 domain-containing protein n=1 Tax=Mucilaginibacter lappiensis TaxID=354630 RepID=A0ABR6PFX9_9SPHI|nr:hypothetical protein [Mucilaginibacter lappiensis]MBB6108671.1 hypothetical protein [Mucilaginibacter lappiensis]SIQ28437.1 hypothetical protein SAMN05421821_10294 [Mucilaginibacter lappiensis]
MKNIFIIHNLQILAEEVIVAVFDDRILAESFIDRNTTIQGKYRIEEKELNPFFIAGKQVPYRVMLLPWDNDEIEVGLIDVFDEELEAFQEVVSKVDDCFHLSIYADNEIEAKAIARERYTEMVANGQWRVLPDVSDQYDEDDD